MCRAVVHTSRGCPPHLTVRYQFGRRRGKTAHINVWPWQKNRDAPFYGGVQVTGVTWRAQVMGMYRYVCFKCTAKYIPLLIVTTTSATPQWLRAETSCSQTQVVFALGKWYPIRVR